MFPTQDEFGTPNSASRVRLTPTAAVTIRSMIGVGGQLEPPFTYRLTSSSGATANVTFTSTAGVFNFDAPVPIPAGGYATLELVHGVPYHSAPWDYDSWPSTGVNRLSEVLRQAPCGLIRLLFPPWRAGRAGGGRAFPTQRAFLCSTAQLAGMAAIALPPCRAILSGAIPWLTSGAGACLLQPGGSPLRSCPTPASPLALPCSPSSCKYSFLDTGSTDPASQTARAVACTGSIVVSAPWVAPTSPTYGLNCTDPADEVGPPQIHTSLNSFSDGLALVPSDSCTPNWADYYSPISSNNPAARVTITPTNASAPVTLRSLFVDLLVSGVADDQPFTFRLAASSGQAVDVFVSAEIVEEGYGAVDFPTPLVIPAGGNATLELIDAVPKYPQVRPAPAAARAPLPACHGGHPASPIALCMWLAAQLAKLQRCGAGPRRPHAATPCSPAADPLPAAKKGLL